MSERSDRAKTADPRGLIREAYRIAGITEPDCRTIFLDWVLGLPDQPACHDAMRLLLEIHGDENPDHPMTRLLRDGLTRPAAARRRRRSSRRAPGQPENGGMQGSGGNFGSRQ